MAQFAQGLRFDLPNALARDGELLSHFFQRVIGFFADAEPHAQDLFFARRQSRQNFAGLFLQVDIHHRIGRRDNSLILDEVAEMTVFLLADGRFEGNRLLGDFQNLADFVERDLHLGGDLLGRRFSADFLH